VLFSDPAPPEIYSLSLHDALPICAKAPQVAVPPVDLWIQVHVREPSIETVESLLALRAADDLTDTWRQDVHCSDGPPVVVHAHVERLDVLRVVHHDDGRLDVVLAQPALVLGLHVHAPVNGTLERLT